MPDYTYSPAPVLVEATGEFAIGATGVLRSAAGGNAVQVYDLNGSPLPNITVGPKGACQAFKADIPDGILDFGSVLLPAISQESLTAALSTQQAAEDAAASADTAAASAAQAAASADTAAAAAVGKADLIGGTVPEAQLPIRLSDVELRAALEARRGAAALPGPAEDPRITWLSQFASGHGWAVILAGTATADANNTEKPGLSAQAVKVNTAGGNVTLRRTGLTWDLTDRSLVIAWQTTQADVDAGFQIFIGDATLANYWSLVVSNKSGVQYRAGKYNLVEIPIESMTVTGTPNRAAIARVDVIFLGTLPTVSYLAGIGSRTKHPTWPNGALTLGFDDGYADHFTIARPKLAERGWAGTAYIIADVLGTTNFMTVDQVRHLQDINGWMVASHSYTVAAHDGRWTTLSADALELEARNLHDWMRANGFRGWRHYAAPGGVFNTATQAAAARYFSTQRQATTLNEPGVLQARPLPLTPAWLPGAEVVAANTATALALVQKAKDGGLWTHLFFHRLNGGTQLSQAQFNQLMDDIAAIGIPVVTPQQVMGY